MVAIAQPNAADTAAALNKLLEEWGSSGGQSDDRRLIHGRVVGAGAGRVVRAYDKDMRTEELLGEATTDTAGGYEIAYTREQYARAEKDSADVRVTVLDDAGREVASTPIIFNAGPVESAPDLSLPDDGLSEYERLIRDLQPLMEDIPFAELTEDDIAFLGGETGVDAERIRWLAEAAKRAQELAAAGNDDRRGGRAGTTRKAAPAVLDGAFYGLFRNGISSDRDALLRTRVKQEDSAWDSPLRTASFRRTLKSMSTRSSGRSRPCRSGSRSLRRAETSRPRWAISFTRCPSASRPLRRLRSPARPAPAGSGRCARNTLTTSSGRKSSRAAKPTRSRSPPSRSTSPTATRRS